MSLETDLAGRSALVTGGGSGIGRAIALALAHEGAGVVIAGRRPRPEVVAELRAVGVPAHGLSVDVSDEARVVRMVADAERHLGGLDLYVNVAAGAWHEPLTRLTTQAWVSTLNTNLSACVWGCREIARRFVAQERGSILVIGSTATASAQPRETAYRASKAALKAHVEVAAVELAPFGVRVNLLTPGATDTAFVPPTSVAQRERALREVPMRREARPDELAASAVFLLSDRLAGYITGADLVVDGGLQLRPIFGGTDDELRDLVR